MSLKKHPICFVNLNNTWGGGEKWHLDHAKHLSDNGHEVFIVTPENGQLYKKAKEANINLFGTAAGNMSFLNIVKLFRLKGFFKRSNISKVVLNGPVDLKLAGMAAKMAGVPDIIYRRGLARPIGRNPLNTFFLKSVIGRLLINSKHTGKVFLENYPELRGAIAMETIYNGVESGPFRVQERPAGSRPVLGTAARFSHEKGQDLLIEVAAKLKSMGHDFELHLAGIGETEEKIRKTIKEQALDSHVKFHGFVEDISEFMRSIDIYLCPSRYEGFGYSVAEAMMAGRPVIAFHVGSLPELVAEGKTGHLIRPFDISDFTEKTSSLLGDAQSCMRLGKEGADFARKNFESGAQMKKFEDWLFLV